MPHRARRVLASVLIASAFVVDADLSATRRARADGASPTALTKPADREGRSAAQLDGFECDVNVGAQGLLESYATLPGRTGPLADEFPILVILVNFADDADCSSGCAGCYQPTNYTVPPEEVYNAFFDTSDPDLVSVNDYFVEVSYHQFEFIGDVAGWYELGIDLCPVRPSGTAVFAGTVTWDIREQAMATAQADGWDVAMDGPYLLSNTYEGVVFVFPRFPGQGFSGAHGTDFNWQSGWALGISAHEQGHLIGLRHASSWDCGDEVWPVSDSCVSVEYGNLFDVMGAHTFAGHFNAAYKRQLGWLDDAQVLTLTGPDDSATYVLTPLSVEDAGVKALHIPRGNKHYYFEFRQPIGFDSGPYEYLVEYADLPADGLDGLVVNRHWGSKTHLLDMTPGSQPSSYTDAQDGALLVDETYLDPIAGFEITPTDIYDAGTAQAELHVAVRFSLIDVDPGPTRTIPYGGQVTIEPVISGGTPPYACTWRPVGGLDDPSACAAVTAQPTQTTTYTIVVHDSGTNSLPNGAQVRVTVLAPDDCNANDLPDACDVACGLPASPCDVPGCGMSPDCDGNAIPDECQPDCNTNGTADTCDVANQTSLDCNSNGTLDECDIAAGDSDDLNDNAIPDECEPPRIIHVDDDAPLDPGPGDATVSDPAEDGSPEHPYDAVQQAIDAATAADLVLVADGLYTGEGNREVDFGGRPINVRSANGPAGCIIDGEASARGFHFHSGETAASVLDGFTIRNGLAVQYGGGVLCEHSAPVIRNCNVISNAAGLRGGGIYCLSGSGVIIADCRIADNIAGSFGGGIHCEGTGSPTICNSIIAGNQAGLVGGGLLSVANATVRNCLIVDNTAPRGGGIYFTAGTPSLSNCTVVDNLAGIGGSNLSCYRSHTTLANCIFWRKTTLSGPSIELRGTHVQATILEVAHSNVVGGATAFDIGDFSTLAWGDGNITADPMLTDPDAQDYHLSAVSPCIDAGDPDPVIDADEADIDGDPRVINGRVDMGADEYDFDCNNNGVHDGADVAWGTSADCNSNGAPDECERDCNSNGVPDVCDIAGGTSRDCNGNGSPDVCDILGGGSHDCDANNVPDECGPDCNGNDLADICDIDAGTSRDCNTNAIPDECEPDCNGNEIADDCDLADGTSMDCNANRTPDECEADCNTNGWPDECDIAASTSDDCNTNGWPDECDIPVCENLWDGFQGHTRFTPMRFIDDLPPGGDGVFWDNPHDLSTAYIERMGCETGGVLDMSVLVYVDSDLADPRAGYVSSEWFQTRNGALLPMRQVYALSFRAKVEVANNSETDWEISIHDATNAQRVVVIRLSSTVSATTGFPGSIVVRDPAPSSTYTDTGVTIGEGTCHAFEVALDNVDDTVKVYIDGDLKVTTTRFQADARRMDYFRVQAALNEASSNRDTQIQLDAFDLCVTGAGVSSAEFADCNANGVLDECDVTAGTSEDCNGNRKPDACDLAAGASQDVNTNGVPDECEICGDPDGDGDVDAEDYAILQASFGYAEGEPGYNSACDLDGDGVITLVDYQLWLECYRDFVGDPLAAPPALGLPGDFDRDGDVDVHDFAELRGCLVGPEVVPAPPADDCRSTFDWDGDSDIDLADFAAFQRAFTG